MNGYISYMDTLGFTSRIKYRDFKDKYEKLIDYIGKVFSRSKINILCGVRQHNNNFSRI